MKSHPLLAGVITRAQQDERARIGHELHDNVSQILGSAQLYLNSLQRDNEDFDFIKEKAIEIILLAIREVRCLSHSMAMPRFGKDGLVGSISRLADDLRQSKRFEVSFQHTDRLSIESQDCQMRLTLFRIVQEQVKNILKHSDATKVEISLNCLNDQVRLQVRDNGRGFDAGAVRDGMGLDHIIERTRLYKGKVLLDTAPGKGCSLIVTLPLKIRRLYDASINPKPVI